MNSHKILKESLQPICMKIIKDPNIENINDLDKFLNSLLIKEAEWNESQSVMNDLKEYAAFPLFFILKKNLQVKRTSSMVEAILETLKTILSHIDFLEWKFFCDVFGVLVSLITKENNSQEVDESVSEEIKVGVLQNVILLCKALPSSLWCEYTSEKFRPQLGHAIFICLKVIEKEKNRDLKIVGLRCVEELAMKSHSFVIDSKALHDLSYTCAYFLPGVALANARVATGGEVQAHKVTVAAIECWRYFVYVVMQDRFLSTFVCDLGVCESFASLRKRLFPGSNEEAGNGISNVTNSGDQEQEEDGPRLKRLKIDASWLKNTSEKLCLLVGSMSSLVSDSHWKVKLTLIQLCQTLLQHCSKSMNKSLVVCLETVITLKSDPSLEVSQAASEAFESFRDHFMSTGDVQETHEVFTEMLEERVFSLTTSLPTVVKSKDDSTILSRLRLLNGILGVLGPHISSLVKIPSHLQRLLRALVVVFTCSTDDPGILSERASSEDRFEGDFSSSSLGHSFRFLMSKTAISTAVDCCKKIGSYGDISCLIDHCVDLIGCSDQRTEAVIVLNYILKGAVQRDDVNSNTKEKLVESIIDTLVQMDIFNGDFSVDCKTKTEESDKSLSSLVHLKTFKSSTSVELAKKNIIFVSNCLLLIGSCSSFIGKGFNVFLSRILSCVLEKAGHENVILSSSASQALCDISSALGFCSIAELIEKSVPFFWFPLSQKLKRLPEFPSAPQVLRVVLKFSRGEVKHFVEELVEDVLSSLDTFHSESVYPLLLIILSFVEALADHKKRAIQVSDDCTASESNNNDLKSLDSVSKPPEQKEESLADFLTKIHENHVALQREMEKNTAMEVTENEEILSNPDIFEKNVESEDQEMEEREKKPNVPKHIDLTVRIMERCSYLLFVRERKSQLAILHIVSNCSSILKDWTDQKLPCFHKIWKPLILRLKDNDFIVLLKALEVCVSMVNSSGDFLLRRFFKDLFPALVTFLQSQSVVSQGKAHKTGYHHTPAFKAQRDILTHLPEILSSWKVGVIEASTLLDILLLYLDSRQPSVLNQLAFDALKIMSKSHSDLVWLRLAYCKGHCVIRPPSSTLVPVEIKGLKPDLMTSVWDLFEELS